MTENYDYNKNGMIQ